MIADSAMTCLQGMPGHDNAMRHRVEALAIVLFSKAYKTEVLAMVILLVLSKTAHETAIVFRGASFHHAWHDLGRMLPCDPFSATLLAISHAV